MVQIADRFDFEFEVPVEPATSYMICSLPRSGSSLLCEGLANTLQAGMPAEYFNPGSIKRLKRRWKVDSFDDYRVQLLARKTSPNGVFGLKVHWGQYVPVVGDRDPRSIFPHLRFVLIRREDLVRQAVSWVRALQTGNWSVSWKDPSGRRQAEFDRDEIHRYLRRLERDAASWEELFERHSIEPYRLTYERLVAEREATLLEVLDFLGVSLPDGFRLDPPALERQADEQSDEWVARYVAETASR